MNIWLGSDLKNASSSNNITEQFSEIYKQKHYCKFRIVEVKALFIWSDGAVICMQPGPIVPIPSADYLRIACLCLCVDRFDAHV